ncbi:hypothetical protein DVP68_21430 [Yersinia enterocolitica]|nr:hypothetical protein [Yersinia enterocolitica]
MSAAPDIEWPVSPE